MVKGLPEEVRNATRLSMNGNNNIQKLSALANLLNGSNMATTNPFLNRLFLQPRYI